MRSEGSYFDRVIFIVVLACFFSFKMFVFKYGSAGLRVDDFLIIFVCLIFIVGGFFRRIGLPVIVTPFVMYVFVAIFSSLYNGYLGRVDLVNALLFSIRHLEYFVFFYVGVFFSIRNMKLDMMFSAYLFLMVVIVPLQMLDILPVASAFSSSRAMGNTNGPYELAIVMAFLSFYFLYSSNPSKTKAFLSVALMLATASRITNLGFLLVMLARLRSWSLKPVLIFLIGIILIPFALFFIGSDAAGYSETSLFARIADLFSGNLLDALSDSVNWVAFSNTSAEFLQNEYINPLVGLSGLSVDASAYIRFYRWISLLNITFDNFDSVLIGLGPSFSSVAVDGYYIRLLAETGLIGFVLYMLFIVRCFRLRVKNVRPFKYYLATLCITAIAIDIFLSYKAMLLFWLYLGWLYGDSRKSLINEHPQHPVYHRDPLSVSLSKSGNMDSM